MPWQVLAQRLVVDSIVMEDLVERCPEYRVPTDFGIGPTARIWIHIVNDGDSPAEVSPIRIHWCDDTITQSVEATLEPSLTLIDAHASAAVVATARLPWFPEIENIGGEQVADSRKQVKEVWVSF